MTQELLKTVLTESLQLVLAAVCVFFIAGLLLDFAGHLLLRIVAQLFGGTAAFVLANWLTFPGVMAHECAHALLAFLTGARITHLALFRPSPNGTLGHVQFCTRGPALQQAIQSTLSAIAPVFCGLALLCLIGWQFPRTDSLALRILLGYLFVSILLHATMSWQDLLCALRGVPLCMLLGYSIVVLIRLAMALGV